MAALDLPDDWLGIVVELVSRLAPRAETWAYGSRVKGENHGASDLDLVLRNPGDLQMPQPALGRVIQAFIDSDLPIVVDVLDWAGLPVAMQLEIERAHVVLTIPERSGDAEERRDKKTM